MKNFVHLHHPLLAHKLGFLRDKNTTSSEFRSIMKEISKFLAYEATKDFETFEEKVETPLAVTKVERMKNPPVIVSVMRAGNGMLDALMDAIPFASSGHIGIYRDKFINNTVEYFFKIPENVEKKTIFLVDPLVATGDTAVACVDRLKQYDVGNVRILSILASEKGLKYLHEVHPDVKVYALGMESELTKEGYLVPGIGDAGDRLYNIR